MSSVEKKPVKIAFPTNDGVTIAQHFGMAQHFAVFASDDHGTTLEEIREGMSNNHLSSPHGHNHQAAAGILSDCDIVVAGGMGMPMYSSLKKLGITVVMTDLSNMLDALNSYVEGSLESKLERLH